CARSAPNEGAFDYW
nr:immunoglobulin heavy chain junction region [Mus musculus]